MIIVTKLPAPELFPNKKNGLHWSKTLAVKKSDQEYGFYATKEVMMNYFPLSKNDLLHMTLQVIYGDKKSRDCDNILAAYKALQDGICRAIGIDDSQIVIVTVDKRFKDKLNPRCICRLERI
jgi:Holliday junction resolvase RusA-like endonuclease